MAEGRQTSVGRWDPFSELDLFRGWDPVREFGSPLGRLMREPRQVAQATRFSPPMDISENEDEYVITAELPGTKNEDVTVEVHDNVLTVHGEKRSEREEENEHRRYVERTFGSFSRSFTLPANAQGDKINAAFRDGVLTIAIPKEEERKPRVVAVQS